MRSLPWTGAVNSKICELLRSEKPLPQCFSDPSRLGGAILLFACGFDGMWLKCCWCPKQRWATQMAVGFLLSSKGGNWGVTEVLWTHSLLLCLYPDCLWHVWSHFHFFPSFSHSTWLKSDLQLTFLAKAEMPPKSWRLQSQWFPDSLSAAEPREAVKVDHLCFTNEEAGTEQVSILIRIFSPAVTKPGVSLLCTMKYPKKGGKINICHSKIPWSWEVSTNRAPN